MKRFVFAVVFTLMLITLAACGKKDDVAETTTKPAASEQETKKADENWYFLKGDVKIEIGAPAQPIIDALGEYQSSYEAPSCAFDGMDVVYTYPGFEVLTYVVDGEAKISGVVLRDDTVETVEGICIGSSKADVETAYGKLEEGATSLQVTKGNCELLVILTDDVVSSIQYLVAD
ncbi:MAG: hypothetical protein IJ744_03025 [Lachnospiraceae bacterium]|nr:hypothetical protein [Lachnospiraceae bacterium]